MFLDGKNLLVLQGNLELSLEQVRRMVGLYPVLLRYPGSSLQTTAEWLTRSLECNKKDVAHIALKSPQVR